MRIIANATISLAYPKLGRYVSATACNDSNGLIRYTRGLRCPVCDWKGSTYHVSSGAGFIYMQIQRLRQIRGTIVFRPLWLGKVWNPRIPSGKREFMHPGKAIARLKKIRNEI